MGRSRRGLQAGTRVGSQYEYFTSMESSKSWRQDRSIIPHAYTVCLAEYLARAIRQCILYSCMHNDRPYARTRLCCHSSLTHGTTLEPSSAATTSTSCVSSATESRTMCDVMFHLPRVPPRRSPRFPSPPPASPLFLSDGWPWLSF